MGVGTMGSRIVTLGGEQVSLYDWVIRQGADEERIFIDLDEDSQPIDLTDHTFIATFDVAGLVTDAVVEPVSLVEGKIRVLLDEDETASMRIQGWWILYVVSPAGQTRLLAEGRVIPTHGA